MLALMAALPPAYAQGGPSEPALPQLRSAGAIEVLDAFFGSRFAADGCRATRKVKEQCDGKQRCAIAASAQLCPSQRDAGSTLIPTLSIRYRCRVGGPIRSAEADRPFAVILSCRPAPAP